MDVRIWGLFAVVIFIGGFAGMAKYFSALDGRYHELAVAEAELKSLEEELAEEQTGAEDAQSKAEKLKGLVAVYDNLEASKQPLVESILALEGQKQAILTAFRETVDEVRRKSVGMQWADVPFRNGQVLRQVRIQKVTNSEITLAHGEGVAKLRSDELPPELKERFRVSMEPFLNVPEPVAAAVGVAPAPRGSASPTSPAVKTPAPTSGVSQAIQDIEREIKSSQEKIKALEKTMFQWKDQAFAFRSQAESARIQGRPTYKANAQAVQAEQQANALEAQLNALRVENAKLREKLVKTLTGSGSRR